MNLKKKVSVAVVAVGLMFSGGYAQAAEPAQSYTGSPFSGTFGGVVDLTVPGGVRDINSSAGKKTEAEKAQPAVAKESGPTGASATSAPSATSASGVAGAAGAAAK